MPGLEIDIFDDTFKRLPHDGESVGEILIRGPWICSEYYKDAQPTKFHDGWLITGDVGKIDPEEYLIISDRSKDLVKSGGEWISSVDLENHIVGMPGVAHRVRRRPPASEMGRTARCARHQKARQQRDGRRRSSNTARRSSRNGNCRTTCCSSRRFRKRRPASWTKRPCARTSMRRAISCRICATKPDNTTQLRRG